MRGLDIRYKFKVLFISIKIKTSEIECKFEY